MENGVGEGGLQATVWGVLKSSPTSVLHFSTYLSEYKASHHRKSYSSVTTVRSSSPILTVTIRA